MTQHTPDRPATSSDLLRAAHPESMPELLCALADLPEEARTGLTVIRTTRGHTMTQQQTGEAVHWTAGPLDAYVDDEGTLTVTVTDGDDLRTVTLVDLKALAEVTSADEAAYISALLVGSACKAHGLSPDDLQPVKDPEVGF